MRAALPPVALSLCLPRLRRRRRSASEYQLSLTVSSSSSLHTHAYLRGKFAVVRRCVDKSSGVCYAAKYLRKNRRTGSGRADIMKEIDIMRLTKDQPRIIQMREVFESDREMIIVLEL